MKSLSAGYLEEIISVRRHIHAHPELSMKEHETSRYITSRLQEKGIDFKTGIAETGIVGIIHGKKPHSRVVGLRADMDALPINEENDVPYVSQNPGVMHACGHDVHSACLLGAAYILHDLRDEFSGTVKLVFQPSEEKYPGGAIMMIKEGVLENPDVDVMIGQHVCPLLDAGEVGMRPGKYMASTDEFYIRVIGKGGHGATPNLNIDPVVIAAHIILALQQIVSRYASPVNPTVVSIGRIVADGKTNIIPDRTDMEGIIRTFDQSWREEIKKKIKNISTSIAESMGARCEVIIDEGYPYLENDGALTERIRKNATEFLGNKKVHELDLKMTAEDFSYYAQRIPSVLYRLGIRNREKGITSNLHTATFNIDESALETGMGLLSWMALNELKNTR